MPMQTVKDFDILHKLTMEIKSGKTLAADSTKGLNKYISRSCARQYTSFFTEAQQQSFADLFSSNRDAWGY